ncbi:alpha/beta hydrolase [Solimonas terrae]|uniref:Alpha/beta fold hydrolase n=1 Tax=Solimonas terrae TaxID=1396819 RepID=A0A6M2BQY4_9GAMM|nr:alpha/beta fold hydrolase [Solimonas terrae]NGY04888.1 alpha/beta fold hydrolase [Solimonas terrae]
MAMAGVGSPLTLKFDCGLQLPGEGALQIAVDLFVPPAGIVPRALLWCLPGGNMNRRYYDLTPPADAGGGDSIPTAEGDAGLDTSFSFARTMAAQGFVVASVDYLGLGDSSKPSDGWLCTPDTLSAINRNVHDALMTKLREGRAYPQLAALPDLRSVGVGHSMGSMMTILQQAAHAPHAAVLLLGFSTRGLPEYLPPQLKGIDDPLAARPLLIDVAKKMYGGQPFPVIHTARAGNSELFGSKKADPKGVAALKAATDCMLPVPATLSMVPGNVAPEAALIDVPVFLGVGGRDMVGPVHQLPLAFTGSSDVTLLVLPETGHSHFLFATRAQLFRRVASWLQAAVLSEPVEA